MKAHRESLEALYAFFYSSRSLLAFGTQHTPHHQLYLFISRPDLVRQVVQHTSAWCDDDVALQPVEVTSFLSTRADAYNDAPGFQTKQPGNPALTSPHLLVAMSFARSMKGEVGEARSDLEEALKDGMSNKIIRTL